MARLGKSYSIGKDGKVKKTARGLDTSAKIRQRKSRKIKVVRPGTK